MDIAKMRREFKRHAKAKLLFLDETYVRIGTCQTHTLVAPGETAYVVVDDTDAYAPRYDMIACCSGERVFPPIIFTPQERAHMDVRGIRKWMLLQVHRQRAGPGRGCVWTCFPSLWSWTVRPSTTPRRSYKRSMTAGAKTCRQCT